MDNAAINEFAKSVKNNELISSFVDSYIEEHDLAISADLILGILDHLQKSSSLSFAASNLPQLFVQMGSFIDVLAALDKQTEDVEEIVEKQVNKLGASPKGKGAFHTLAENLKSELVRLMLDEPKKKSPPPPPPQKEKKKSGMEMSEMLKLGSKLLQGDGAGNIASLLGGGGAAGIASLLGGEGVGQIANLLGGNGGGQIASLLGEAGDGLIENLLGGEGAGLIANLLGGKGGGQIANFLQSGGARQIASLLSGDMLSNIDSTKIDLLLKMAMNYAKGTPWEAYVKQFGENVLQGSGMFQKVVGSESGRRLLLAVPKIMSSKDLECFKKWLVLNLEEDSFLLFLKSCLPKIWTLCFLSRARRLNGTGASFLAILTIVFISKWLCMKWLDIFFLGWILINFKALLKIYSPP